MEMEDLISVIVPVYKVEKYLNTCVQSIVNQTYQNLEIILVDDGSPDQCPAICDEWKQRDSRIVVLHKKNGGLSSARNAGIRIAKGKYIGFVDSDDYIDSDMYKKLYGAIKDAKAELAVCSFELVNEEGKALESISPIKNEIFSGKIGLDKLTQKNGWHYVTAWNKLYSAKALEGLNFPEEKIHEDEFMIHRVFWNCSKVVSLEEKLYQYVQRQGSITSTLDVIKRLDVIEALCDRALFYQTHGLERNLAETLPGLKALYINNRLLLFSKKMKDERIRKIDKMFYKVYCQCKKVSIKEKFILHYPMFMYLYFKYYTK